MRRYEAKNLKGTMMGNLNRLSLITNGELSIELNFPRGDSRDVTYFNHRCNVRAAFKCLTFCVTKHSFKDFF